MPNFRVLSLLVEKLSLKHFWVIFTLVRGRVVEHSGGPEGLTIGLSTFGHFILLVVLVLGSTLVKTRTL